MAFEPLQTTTSARRARTAGVLLLGAAALAGGACATADPPPRAPAAVFPAAAWARVPDPAAAGWSREGLEAVRQRLVRSQSSAFMAVHGGRVVFEYGDVRTASSVASVRKSLLSVLYGPHVARGTIRLDKTLRELRIDDLGGITAAEKEATVRDLLAARSGVYHPAANAGDGWEHAPPRGSKRHGTYFLYNNWDFNVLGTIFEQETGQNIYDAFARDLAGPLGMQDFDRAAQRRGGDAKRSIHLAYHLRLSTRDLARVGHLMLHEGSWAGRQLVPRDWVRESTRVVTPVGDINPRSMRGPWGYGYLWWVWDGRSATGVYRDAFTAHGMAGQHLSVLPRLDLVVAHETRQDLDLRVPHREFVEILDVLVRARCRTTPCS